MDVVDPGHDYELDWLDVEQGYNAEDLYGPGCRDLVFVKRIGEKYPGNKSRHPGTNCQEVLRVLIDRVKFLDGQRPHDYNEHIVSHLREAIRFLEMRAAELHGRDFSQFRDDDAIELLPTCKKCGHIGCGGECHP